MNISIRQWSAAILLLGILTQLTTATVGVFIASQLDKKASRDLNHKEMDSVFQEYSNPILGNAIVGHTDIQIQLLNRIANSRNVHLELRNIDGTIVCSSKRSESVDEVTSAEYELNFAGKSYGTLLVSKTLEPFLWKYRYYLLFLLGSQFLAMSGLIFLANYIFPKYLLQPFEEIVNSAKPLNRRLRNKFLIPLEALRLSDMLKKLQSDAARRERDTAIADTTRMLAHDVRTPFALVKSLADLIRGSENSSDVNKHVERYLPEVDKAIKKVNVMLSDIVEADPFGRLKLEPTELVPIINNSLRDVALSNTRHSIDIEYSLKHLFLGSIEPSKIERVFTNILNNAVHAMKGNGKIWIHTRSLRRSNKSCIEIKIGNTNSFISQEDLEHLFKAYFTKDKSGGTGLGLTIVKQIIEAHGGSICCTSTRNCGVEFTITLPSTYDLANPTLGANLPATLDGWFIGENRVPERNKSYQVDETVELKTSEKPLVAIVDDSLLMLEAWQSKLKNEAEVTLFAHPSEFWKEVEINPHILERLSVIIIDYHFEGDLSTSGLDLAKNVRTKAPSAKLIVSSNADLQHLDLSDVDHVISKHPIAWKDMSKIAKS